MVLDDLDVDTGRGCVVDAVDADVDASQRRRRRLPVRLEPLVLLDVGDL